MTAATATTVQYLNLAYFGRPADPASLSAFPATGMTDEQIVESFVKTNEYATNTLAPSTDGSTVNQTSLINTIYQRLFGRLAASTEIQGWTTALASGTVNQDYLGITIMRAGLNLPASTSMRQVLVAKFESAQAFTTSLAADSASAQAYSTSAAISSASSFLAGVTTSTAATSAEVTAAVSAMVATGTSTSSGSAFSLTSKVDDLVGTGLDDTFTAAGGRLNDDDAISGGAGNDTLTATVAASADAYIDGVETINIKALGTSGAMVGGRIEGVSTLNVSGGGTLSYTGAASGITYGVSGADTALTMTQAGTDSAADAVSVSLGAGKSGTLTLGDTAGLDFETINVAIAGAGEATITEAGTPEYEGDKFVVTGSADYELNLSHAAMGGNTTASSAVAVSVDASAHTGKLTVDLGVLETENVSAKKFTGVDAIKIGTDDTGGVQNQLIDVASGTEVIVDSVEAVDNTLTIDPNGTSTSDSLTVTLNNGTAGSVVDLTTVTVDGFETTTINSTGTDSSTTVVKNVIDTIAGTAADKTLVITGDKKLTAGTENTWTNISVTNTAGVDLTVASGSDVSITGGTGADRIEIDALSDITAADSLKGGSGKDTLALSQTIGTDFSTAQLAVVSGFEVLEYEGAQDIKTAAAAQTVDLTKLTGINELFVNGTITTDTGGDTLTVKADDGFTVTMGAHSVDGGSAEQLDFQITGASVAGTANTVNVNLVDIGSNTTNGGFQVDNVETVNLNIAGDAGHTYTLSDIDGVVLQTLNIASTNTTADTASDSLTVSAIESSIISTLDASAFTGALDISAVTGFSVTGATITGGSGVNTITAGTGADIITTGKGNDTIKGGTGADQITSGAGDDIVYAATGTDSTPESSGIVTLLGSGTNGALDTGDFFQTTLFGKTITGETYIASSNTVGTTTLLAADLATKINADAVISQFVTATASQATITITADIDGDFGNFVVTESTNATPTVSSSAGEGQVDGTNSTDIDIINLGAGADKVHASGGIDLINLGELDSSADTVYVLTLSDGADVITGFESGSIGSDVISFGGDLFNNGTDTDTLYPSPTLVQLLMPCVLRSQLQLQPLVPTLQPRSLLTLRTLLLQVSPTVMTSSSPSTTEATPICGASLRMVLLVFRPTILPLLASSWVLRHR